MNIFWVASVLSQWFLAFQAQFKCVIRKPLGIQVGLGTHEVGIWFFSHYVKIINSVYLIEASPSGSVSKESAYDAGDLGSISGLERSPGEGNGNTCQYTCLGNPMDRGAWWPTVHGVARVRHNLATKPPPPHLIDFHLIEMRSCTLFDFFLNGKPEEKVLSWCLWMKLNSVVCVFLFWRENLW